MIEVGEYIRTRKGITKIKKVNNKKGCALCENSLIVNVETHKHSKNIIDLIEIGDYVNGILITGKESTLLYTDIKGIDRSGYHIPISQYGENINTILTHEQYEQNCYKVGDIE